MLVGVTSVPISTWEAATGNTPHLEHCKVGLRERPKVDGVAVSEENEGEDGEYGHNDAHDGEGVGH